MCEWGTQVQHEIALTIEVEGIVVHIVGLESDYPCRCGVWDLQVGYNGRIAVTKRSVEGLKYSPRVYYAKAVRVRHAIVGAEGERE
jgi:hypothetical protein